MTHDEAVELILEEAYGETSIVVAARMGDALRVDRIQRVTDAVRVVSGTLRGCGRLDRKFAAALHVLGSMVLREVESGAARSGEIPQDVFDAIVELEMEILWLFEDAGDDV